MKHKSLFSLIVTYIQLKRRLEQCGTGPDFVHGCGFLHVISCVSFQSCELNYAQNWNIASNICE